MIASPLTRRFLVGLWFTAFVFRLLAGALHPIPAEDGANYLWMAERMAAGEFQLALSEVFPPLWPMCIAPFVWLGLDPFRAGQLVAAIIGATAVIVIVRMTVVLWPKGGVCAGCIMVFASLPVRFGALVYSETLFLLLAAWSTLLGLRGRYLVCGLLAGLAFWTRPEGALIAVAFALGRAPRGVLALIPLGVLVFGLAAWRDHLGLGFDLLPKLGFNLAREHHEGLGIESLGGFASNVARTAWLWFEAFGLVGLLAIPGIVAVVRGRAAEGSARSFAPLWILLALGFLLIVAFLPRRRFFVSWAFAVAPFAVAGLWTIPERGRWVTLLVVVMTSFLFALKLPQQDRYAEFVVGDHLRTRLDAGEHVAGDMTRVIYFSGCRPLPPRHFSAEQLEDRAREDGVRFVVIGERRATGRPLIRALADRFEPALDLPADVARQAKLRGIAVLRRREPR